MGGVAAVLVLAALAVFLLRQTIGEWAFGVLKNVAHNRYNTEITVSSFRVDGVSGATLTKLMVAAPGRDTLLKADTLSFKLRLLPLLVGRIRFGELRLVNTQATLNLCSGESTFSARRRITAPEATVQTAINFSGRINSLYRQIVARLPQRLFADNLTVKAVSQRQDILYTMPRLVWDDDTVHATILCGGKEWFAAGVRNTHGQLLHVRVTTPGDAFFPLPGVDDRLNLQLGFSSLGFGISELDVAADEVRLRADVRANRFWVNQPKLCREPILMDSLQAAVDFFASPTTIRLDSTAQGKVNAIPFSAYAELSLAKDTTIALRFKTDTLPAQQFFDALPATVFASARGMQVQGKLAYSMQMRYTSTVPDSADFDAGFAAENFRLVRYGNVNLSKLKEDFTHQPWRDKREILMGPPNPAFTRLDDISMYLKDAVVTSEDGSFYWHKGFNLKATKHSIAENIRKGQFARGGSTITMQLVKNVFLRPEKTIARKLEEALLVWLIESQRLVSKDRMLEVYLNAIEWGPNIYGIEEAARFYFERHPSQLYLPQSIFLAMIVPSPRRYMYNFEQAPDSLRQQGVEFTLRPAFQQYFKLVGGIMLARDKITQEQFEALDYREIQLQGESLRLLRKTLRDKQPEETKIVEEMEEEMDDLDLQ